MTCPPPGVLPGTQLCEAMKLPVEEKEPAALAARPRPAGTGASARARLPGLVLLARGLAAGDAAALAAWARIGPALSGVR
jgi:hypothetical protein